MDFAPYSPKRPKLVEQAGWLARELVSGRVHPFPCDCGVCVYGRYREGDKAKGRLFSKRTFFVYFLRADMFTSALCDNLPPRGGPDADGWLRKRDERLKRAARIQRGEEADKKHLEQDPGILMTDIYAKLLRDSTRRKTLGMIQQLARRERRRDVKEFLAGLLVKKNFYVYYNARGRRDELGSIVTAMRRELAGMRDRRSLKPAPAHRVGRT